MRVGFDRILLPMETTRLGRVSSLWITAEAKEPMQAVDSVRAVAGRGLEGDRYFFGKGSFDRAELPSSGRALTLIERESVEICRRKLAQELGSRALSAGELRRNIVTEHVALDELVGATFRIGDAVLKGIRLTPPCRLLQRLTELDVMHGLAKRGGLRVDILESGTIRAGDDVLLLEPGRGRLPI